MTPPRSEPFRIHVPDADIADLHRRLDATRFAPDMANDDWRYGVPSDVLREWVAAWRRFDWRDAEEELNRFENHRVVLDDVPIHFVYRRGRGPAPVPVILTHGWPWTYWDWHATVEALADPGSHGGDPLDAFDVVVPSLPGFAFSSPLRRPTRGASETAALWVRLMTEVLGYERFAAVGGDMGNMVTAAMGHAHADRLIGIHLLGAVPLSFSATGSAVAGLEWESDWGFPRPETPPSDPVLAARPLTDGAPPSAHRIVHVREPQTLAAGLHDSPAGMLAWLLKARHLWRGGREEDVRTAFSERFLLTTFSLYWFTETAWSSVRAYRATADNRWVPVHDRTPVVEAPTGITFFEHDQTSRSRFWAADYYDLRRTSYSPVGGHFAPAEVPEVVVEEIRETFRRVGAHRR
ncbi:epoxide hydrolase family protein [Pseudonocardia pini]|uniref:epoxide hydrolase family protein n=1 Tax=Pseudonocardia pini TaxID=2758030 RepID=UPI0015F11DE6|nr:epoxide hydrolase [Pseudonocardia pini]